MRLVERELARQLEVERDVEAVGKLDHGQVVDLADARDRHRGLAHALAQRRLGPGRLDVDDDVASGQRGVDGRLDAVRDGVALADRSAGRDADHDIGERAPGRLPQAQAPHLDGRVERGDRGPRRTHGIGRRAVHQHVDVAPDQPHRRRDHEERDEERGHRVARGPAAADREQAARAPPACPRGRSRSGARSRRAPGS